MMTKSDGWAAKRAAFLKKTLWVCRDVEGEDTGTVRMWPAGKYVPQTKEEPEDSVGSWVEGQKPVEDEDILVFVTVGKHSVAINISKTWFDNFLYFQGLLTFPDRKIGRCKSFSHF